jgi:hypothetical protein
LHCGQKEVIIKKQAILFGILVLLVSACAPAPAPAAATNTESAPPATATSTSAATETPEPSPTPLPGPLSQSFADLEILFAEDFDASQISNYHPEGWGEDGSKSNVFVDSGGRLRIVGEDNVVYFSGESISKNEIIYMLFQYSEGSFFTMGIDALKPNDERVPFGTGGTGVFSSVALQMRDTLTAHIINEPYQKDELFDGSLELKSLTWYAFALSLTEDNHFAIKVWDPVHPTDMLTYEVERQGMANQYLFIMWIDNGARLYLDDFTLLKFSEVVDLE